MRIASAALVVDASVLIAALLGRSSGALLRAAQRRPLATTDRCVGEVRRQVALGLKQPELLDVLDALLEQMLVVSEAALAASLPWAQTALREAVSSRNGSTADAHLLALAWALDADVWSADRDFAGTGQPSWSTANLMRALGAEPPG